MGLFRVLMKLFAPLRQTRRYQETIFDYPPRPAATKPASLRLVPQEPLRQVEEQAGQQIIKGHCWVIDGDTIVINKVQIRLAGIDAPELNHPYGQNAKRLLIGLCCGQVVTAITDGSTMSEQWPCAISQMAGICPLKW